MPLLWSAEPATVQGYIRSLERFTLERLLSRLSRLEGAAYAAHADLQCAALIGAPLVGLLQLEYQARTMCNKARCTDDLLGRAHTHAVG